MWPRKVVYGARRASAALVTGPARSRPYGSEVLTGRAAGVGPALFGEAGMHARGSGQDRMCMGAMARQAAGEYRGERTLSSRWRFAAPLRPSCRPHSFRRSKQAIPCGWCTK